MTSKIAIKFVLECYIPLFSPFCANHSALTPKVDIKREEKYGQRAVYISILSPLNIFHQLFTLFKKK